MVICKTCASLVPESVNLCPSCGQPSWASSGQQAPAYQTYTQPQHQPLYQQSPPPASVSDDSSARTMSILAYIFFFVPLLAGAHKTSPFVKHHTNQGTALFFLALAYSIVSIVLRSIIKVQVTVWGIPTGAYYTPGWLNTILWLASIFLFVLCALGIRNARYNRMDKLPIIGGFTVIK